MRAMGWSWSDLEAAPVYVRRFCSDFLALRADAESSDGQADADGLSDQIGAIRKRVIQHEGW